MTDEMTVAVSATALRRLGEDILTANGTPADLAAVVSNSLVEANLAGHDSHGVLRLVSYAERVRSGKVQPAARARIESRHGATGRIDGAWGWGQPAAHLAVEAAIGIAREHGVAVVTVAHCNHIGRLGEYVERLTQQGMVAMAMCNANSLVAPYGGRSRLLGTNPFAFAAPRKTASEPILLDFATAAVAEGKLRVARAKHQAVPPGLIIDPSGHPTTDPEDFYSGGALLPFGGHKGYGMSIMVEVLGGVLSGTGASCLPDYTGGNGTVILAIDIGSYLPLDAFMSQSDALGSMIKQSPRADESTEILIPGEPEALSRRQRRDKIQLPVQTWTEIKTLADQFGVDPKRT